MNMLAWEDRIMLPAPMHTVTVCLLAVAAIAVWVVSHAVRRAIVRAGGPRWLGGVMFCVRVGVGAAALWAGAQALQRGVVLATDWAFWPIALLAAC